MPNWGEWWLSISQIDSKQIKDKSIQEIIGEGFDENEVRKIVSLIDFNEYKRRQAPLGIKISDRNFGKDRRYPITNAWKP